MTSMPESMAEQGMKYSEAIRGRIYARTAQEDATNLARFRQTESNQRRRIRLLIHNSGSRQAASSPSRLAPSWEKTRRVP
jgi:hypothetical protein